MNTDVSVRIPDAAGVLDAWAVRTGRTPTGAAPAAPAPTALEPLLPEAGARPDFLYRVAPEALVIPGYDDKQEGDERNSLPLDEPMVLSIMALGVFEPIVVKFVPANGVAAHYEVIAGRRRTRHAREANRLLVLDGEAPLTVPVLVKSARLSPEMALVVDVTLNEHRYNDPVPVKMRKARKMLDKGIDISTVAIAFRVTPECVNWWVRAETACVEVQGALDTGRVSMRVAAELASLPESEQAPALAHLLAEKFTGEAAETAVRAIRRRQPVPGRVPRRAVRWVLEGAENFDASFIEGIRFVKGELSEERVREIMAKVGR